jgi:hypothetical protein
MKNEETDLSFAGFGDPKRSYTAPRNETELEDVADYLRSVARREGFACSLRSLVESVSAETLTEVRDFQRLSCWRAGRDSRGSFARLRNEAKLAREEESQIEEDQWLTL